MDTQAKLLNEKYLGIRLNTIKEIKNHEVFYKIEKSNRTFSKSIYIRFYRPSTSNGSWHRSSSLRISDHESDNCVITQLIIEPDKPLTKKVKKDFLNCVERVIKKAIYRSLCKTMDKLSRERRNKSNQQGFWPIFKV
jgi:hypothetical protein